MSAPDFRPQLQPDEVAAVTRESRIQAEVDALEIRAEAQRRVRADRAITPPAPVRLDEFLAVQDEPARFRIDRVLPVGGRALLSAAFKAGKSTLIANLLRSLVDGLPFLGEFAVSPLPGPVVLLDDELDERMLRRWLRDQGVRNTAAVIVLPFRGRTSALNLTDPAIRLELAGLLTPYRPAFVVLDCLRPVLDAAGLSEDKDAGRMLGGFDELLGLCGAAEGVVVHHHGHAGDRPRGDSRLRDWPDAEWTLVRESDDPGAVRYFRATGRDVDVTETALQFDPAARRLTLATGNRRDAQAAELLGSVRDLLAEEPGLSGRVIETRLAETAGRNEIRVAVKFGVRTGEIVARPGPRRGTAHYLAEDRSSAPVGGGALDSDAIMGDQQGDECASVVHPLFPQADEPVRQCATSPPVVRQRTGSECASAPPPSKGGALSGELAHNEINSRPRDVWRVSGREVDPPGEESL